VDEAKGIMQSTRVPLPEDVVVGRSLADARGVTKSAREVGADEMILDVGPKTAAAYAGTVAGAGTVVWNGPVGVFENNAFSKGTETLARAVAASGAFSIAGGGDTVAAINKFGMAEGVSYISTAGGAFLEFLEGKTLPAVAALEARA
jgi:phosphoglycerate kinase